MVKARTLLTAAQKIADDHDLQLLAGEISFLKSMNNKLFLKSILEKEVDISNNIYQKDFEDITYKVNWDVLGVIGKFIGYIDGFSQDPS
jgi:hypothetical protein